MPNLYIIAGCNGAGKTTASYTVLPEMLNCYEFVNADEIAKGLSPFQPEKVAFKAGRIMLARIKTLIHQNVDFAFETTLSTRSYLPFLKEAKLNGFTIVLIFFWLESIELAKERVKERVSKGGHSIPPEVIERRYTKGLVNFFSMFSTISDYWIFFDNSEGIPKVIAEGSQKLVSSINNPEIWSNLKDSYDCTEKE